MFSVASPLYSLRCQNLGSTILCKGASSAFHIFRSSQGEIIAAEKNPEPWHDTDHLVQPNLGMCVPMVGTSESNAKSIEVDMTFILCRRVQLGLE